MDEIDKRVSAGESEEDVTLAGRTRTVEKSAADRVNARTTPTAFPGLWDRRQPAPGILAKAGGQGEAAATIIAFGTPWSVRSPRPRLSRHLAVHARRAPERRLCADESRRPVSVHDPASSGRRANAQVGSVLTFVGFLILVVVIV